ncbi:type II toxin-antitoxin system PemK/MazF family toxin [Idiomarina abyssalis]|uniref:Type II toxin-antitoxin system PemK/MazF family toxin n=1 Tax=Idiomarina abyssalis TaxID=86102 RepID=A0A8I1KHL1_9GAMM|nr:type II toxin-antitoxin system PemK/MazF family toxin [Idiomarina abyssalis]MBJ7266366.1 type II toxin-antitoxin system PemK/MazF family toxin [Idiomarina abyssalis]MBJ7316923.1 type II toxin-antitoxin system PemK/MazF family toxin [Idiomarina abyssalis]
MTNRYIPKRGDIVYTDFDPSAGHEQAHKRPALVLSPEPFNNQVQLALVAPITSTVRDHGFEVKLTQQTKTQGVVLCQQVRTIDYQSRGVKFIEKAPQSVINDALARVRVLVN